MNLTEEYSQLATYNSEVARGLVHTPEWQAKMARVQEQYNQDQKAWIDSTYGPTHHIIVLEGGGHLCLPKES